jgi:hypothetical protein
MRHHLDVISREVRKSTLLSLFYTKKPTYQDRLRTNIGNVEQKADLATSCFTFLPVDEQLSHELTQFTRKCAGKVCNTQASFNKHMASLDSACCGVDGSGCVNGLPTTCEKALVPSSVASARC